MRAIDFDPNLDFAHFQDSTTRAEAETRYLIVLEKLTQIYEAYLKEHPETPPVYESGVVFRSYFADENHSFDDIPRMLARKTASADCLAAWRAAELRRKQIPATVFLQHKKRLNGGVTLIPNVLLFGDEKIIEVVRDRCVEDCLTSSPLNQVYGRASDESLDDLAKAYGLARAEEMETFPMDVRTHKSEVILHDSSCPRCGCHQRRHFECGCGAVHDDYCDNCNRWSSLPANEHVELSELDAPCSAGKADHVHTEAEKSARIDAMFNRIKNRGRN